MRARRNLPIFYSVKSNKDMFAIYIYIYYNIYIYHYIIYIYMYVIICPYVEYVHIYMNGDMSILWNMFCQPYMEVLPFI